MDALRRKYKVCEGKNIMSFFYHELKNHINRDSLSDWFDLIHHKYGSFKKDRPNIFYKEINKDKEDYINNFLDHIRNHELFYENQQHVQIKMKIKGKEKFVAYNSNLYNKSLNLYVKPDLIFHREVFQELFPEIKIDLPEYIIIDILFKNIHFNSTKTDILNNGSIYYHKCKMYVANSSLGLKGKGFFFGKEYRHKDNILPKKEWFGFFPLTEDLKYTVKDAKGWLMRLRENYDKWKIYPEPSIIELYPNMNRKEGNWNDEKTILAHLIKEITLIWNISYNKRCSLHNEGIKCWDDPFLLTNIYKFRVRENHTEYVQQKMIDINLQDEIKIEPRKIKNREFKEKIKEQADSIILDIESVINFDESESYFEEKKKLEHPRISIIGTILNRDEYIFKDFTIRDLTNEEEKKIIQYWINYLDNNFTSTIRVYHWGNAEKVYLKYMKMKYPDLIFPNLEMIDLLYYFKGEPIRIKGCFGYGLKEIVKNLYNLELIDNYWEDDISGLDALVEFKKYSKIAQEKNIPLKRFPQIKKIIYYNYMDCRVIIDILKILEKMI
jgi:hypothetical protein